MTDTTVLNTKKGLDIGRLSHGPAFDPLVVTAKKIS